MNLLEIPVSSLVSYLPLLGGTLADGAAGHWQSDSVKLGPVTVVVYVTIGWPSSPRSLGDGAFLVYGKRSTSSRIGFIVAPEVPVVLHCFDPSKAAELTDKVTMISPQTVRSPRLRPFDGGISCGSGIVLRIEAVDRD